MPPLPRHPLLYQLNVRSTLRSCGGRSFNDIPNGLLDEIQALGFDVIYLLGVWQTGAAGLEMSVRKMAPEGFKTEELCSSPFAITDYRLNDEFGGEKSFSLFRKRLIARGLAVIVDFVPNHVARDHVWTKERPEFLMQGDKDWLKREPQNFYEAEGKVFAHGKDPFFDGWSDTAQLNYYNPELRKELQRVLVAIAGLADGVRCDMAMLVLNDIFDRTWKQLRPTNLPEKLGEFWPEAIQKVKKANPDFIFMAEVYWDMEHKLQTLGFDFTYDKRLYDRLKSGPAEEVTGHLRADMAFQEKSVRFLENHDEHRAAAEFPDLKRHTAALTICYTSPGLRFFHQGQLQGRKSFLSMHVAQRREEPMDEQVLGKYLQLLKQVLPRPELRTGTLQLLETTASKDGSSSFRSLIARLAIKEENGSKRETKASEVSSGTLILVNYSEHDTHGHVRLPAKFLSQLTQRGCSSIILHDIYGGPTYIRPLDKTMDEEGCWFRLAPWESLVFELLERRSTEL